MSLHFISRTRDDPPSRIVASPLAEALHSWRLRLRRPCTLMGEGRPPCRPHIRRPGEGRPPCRPHIRRPWEGRPPCRPHIRRPWEGRPPRRPHFHVASGFIPRLCPWVRSVLAIRPGVKPVATSASGGTTSAPYSTNAISSSGRPSTKSPHR
jgi:hypothetical protein